VLIIEDQTEHIALVKLRLTANGIEVSAASTAAGGAAAAEKEKPDLILLDLLLPDMPPEEAIRALRAVPGAAKTPILALTALDPVEIRRRNLEGELSGVIAKPYEAKELLNRIKKLTRK